MDLQSYLDQNRITKYALSKKSGVPKTTIMDICAGRSEIERCSAKTVQQLARALGLSMEDVMGMSCAYDRKTGKPQEREYLECGLPPFLSDSIEAMKNAWAKLDRGERYLRWDCDYCSLQTDINNAEVNGIISPDQAWYLRKKYLRMESV